jgi:hypothetical protein
MAKRGRKAKPLSLTAACAGLLKELESDLRARLEEESEVSERFAAEYTEAKAVGRTGRTQTDWLTEQLTQIGASWILACVFVRFAEDNALLERPMLAGRAEGEAGAPSPLSRAQDAERAYYAEHPTHAEPEYLAHVLTGVAHLPGMSDLLDSARSTTSQASCAGTSRIPSSTRASWETCTRTCPRPCASTTPCCKRRTSSRPSSSIAPSSRRSRLSASKASG